MSTWLICEVSLGQFDNEASVRAVDFQGEQFSLFVPRESVMPTKLSENWVQGCVLVEVLDTEGENVLIYLPGKTFSNGQTITVRKDQLKRAEQCAAV